MGHPFDVRCCKVNIFFSFAHHVSCFFSHFFSCHTPHWTIWHIFPTDNSGMASSCIPQSILLPHTINPTVSHNQSYSLQQSILQSPTINPTVSRHILSPLLYGFPSLCAVIYHAVTPIPVITSLAIYALRSTKALPANMARACGNERETRPLSTAADIGCVSGSANASSPVSPIGTGWARHPVPMTCSSSTYGPVIQYLLHCSHISLTFWLLALQVLLSLIRCLLGLTG